MTFVLFQSRDGERGEKRGLVVDWEDGRTMLHLREKGGRRNPYQCSKDKREKKRKEGREGGWEREEEEGEVEREREKEREREREREREISALLLNTICEFLKLNSKAA